MLLFSSLYEHLFHHCSFQNKEKLTVLSTRSTFLWGATYQESLFASFERNSWTMMLCYEIRIRNQFNNTLYGARRTSIRQSALIYVLLFVDSDECAFEDNFQYHVIIKFTLHF
ncbi:unnamed protein product [Rhizopus stolonifer]